VIPLYLPNTAGLPVNEVAELVSRKAVEFHRTVNREAAASIPLTDGIIKMLIQQELHAALAHMSGSTKASFVLDQIKSMTEAQLPTQEDAQEEAVDATSDEAEEVEINF